jgi:hypothetical protein
METLRPENSYCDRKIMDPSYPGDQSIKKPANRSNSGMNSHTGEGALRMDSENVGEGCAGWILRVLIDEEWEEGGFPSRAEPKPRRITKD